MFFPSCIRFLVYIFLIIRWLLVGPMRAGATFHKDPNWTSAWNALISGKKKWIFYPPDVTPLGNLPLFGSLVSLVRVANRNRSLRYSFFSPNDYFCVSNHIGVIEEEGGLSVTVPSTLIQWFNDFYSKKHVKRIEFIQHPGTTYFLRNNFLFYKIGDLVYVPSGWWHQVINLETSVAITHNFVNDSNLKKTYTFLKTKEVGLFS